MSAPTRKTPFPGIGSPGSATAGDASAIAATQATNPADARDTIAGCMIVHSPLCCPPNGSVCPSVLEHPVIGKTGAVPLSGISAYACSGRVSLDFSRDCVWHGVRLTKAPVLHWITSPVSPGAIAGHCALYRRPTTAGVRPLPHAMAGGPVPARRDPSGPDRRPPRSWSAETPTAPRQDRRLGGPWCKAA
jgi:hypothetical protein